MTETPTDDRPGFVAEKPEHCRACCRLIRPGQTYYLTIGQAILCEDCFGEADEIRVTDDLAVVVADGRLLMRRGIAAVEVSPSEAGHPRNGTRQLQVPEVGPSPVSFRACLPPQLQDDLF